MSMKVQDDRPVPGRPRHRRIVVPVLVLAVALLAGAVAVTYVGFHRGGPFPDQMRRDLASQTRSILENSPVIANLGVAGHLHDPGAANKVLCAVDPFGTDPADATRAAQVRVVYAQHLCAIAPAGTP